MSSPDMYLEYVKEREGLSVETCDHGFATYSISGDECYIKDIYIQPDFRRKGIAFTLADKIAEKAKGKGCKWLTGSVSPPAKNSHASLLTLLAYGMKLVKSDKDLVYLGKRI